MLAIPLFKAYLFLLAVSVINLREFSLIFHSRNLTLTNLRKTAGFYSQNREILHPWNFTFARFAPLKSDVVVVSACSIKTNILREKKQKKYQTSKRITYTQSKQTTSFTKQTWTMHLDPPLKLTLNLGLWEKLSATSQHSNKYRLFLV